MNLSLQDLIAIVMPYMTPVVIAMIAGCMLYDPTMKMLLYSGLPGQYQSWASAVICFAEEMRFLVILVGVAVPIWQFQVIAFDLVNRKLTETLKAMETE